MRIIFFGTSSFAAAILEDLIAQHMNVIAVITRPDRPKGRSGTPSSPPVKITAQAVCPAVPIYQPEVASAPEFAEILLAMNPDLFIVAAYGEIIKQNLLDIPLLGCINVHASILPKYRGAAPIQRCIMNGEEESGVTIMYMVRKMDAGDMIKIIKTPITAEMTAGELEDRLCRLGCQALIEVIQDLKEGQVQRTPQNHEEATFAPKIELEDGEVFWTRPVKEIHNLVRGVTPFPGAWCYVTVRGQKKRLKLLKTKIHEEDSTQFPGSVQYGNEGIVISCGLGSLCILELQMEGKKAMSAKAFCQGNDIRSIFF